MVFSRTIGRPEKNIFNRLRFRQMYQWIHTKYKITDYEIAKKMAVIDENADVGPYKACLSRIKTSAANIDTHKIWLLAKALEMSDQNTERVNIRGLFHAITGITMKLHALITPAFVERGTGDNGLLLIGAKYFLYSLCKGIDKKFYLPLHVYEAYLSFSDSGTETQSAIPSPDDLAIDLLEIIVKNGFIPKEPKDIPSLIHILKDKISQALQRQLYGEKADVDNGIDMIFSSLLYCLDA